MQTIERYWPLVVAGMVSATFYHFQNTISGLNEIITNLLSATLSICGTLLGFLLTILTIINTINTRRMKFVKDSGYYPILNFRLKVALWLDLVGVSLSFIYPILKSINSQQEVIIYYNVGVIFIVSYMLFANIRFTTIFIKLLTDPDR